MAIRIMIVITLSFGVVSCGVKGDPLPRVTTDS
jgi:hypothetical protein